MSRSAHSNLMDRDDGFDYEESGGGEHEDADYADQPVEYEEQGEQGEQKDQRARPASGWLPRARTNRLVLLFGLVMLVLLLAAAIWLLDGRSTGESRNTYPISGTGVTGISGLDAGPRVGAPAPDFELTDIGTGKVVKLSSLRGRPVWLNYFATWCPPCKAELPDIKRAYARHKDEGLVIIGIDMREDPAQVKAFTGSNGYDWTFVVDTDGKVADRYFVYGIPTHIFIDKEGVIRAVSVGGLTPDAMEQNVSMIVGR